MKQYALDLWARAAETLRVARALVGYSNDSAASRAYYAAFYAVSALFAMEGKTFKKHHSVAIAVHRDLVSTGRWTAELGSDFSRLVALRERGDYGGRRHASIEDAEEAVERASRVLEKVKSEHKDLFLADASADLFQ